MKQIGRHFPDNIFKCILLKFIPKVRINNIPALVQIMAWRRTGDKPLSEPMIFFFFTDAYIYVCHLASMSFVVSNI